MKIHFILSHPAVPENIGFACRAMKTMGFDQLRLVAPPEDLENKIKKTAYGSIDIYNSAIVCSTLNEAVQDIDLVIGTTAKKRVGRHDFHTPATLNSIIESKAGMVENVGLVFGSERNGLSNVG